MRKKTNQPRRRRKNRIHRKTQYTKERKKKKKRKQRQSGTMLNHKYKKPRCQLGEKSEIYLELNYVIHRHAMHLRVLEVGNCFLKLFRQQRKWIFNLQSCVASTALYVEKIRRWAFKIYI